MMDLFVKNWRTSLIGLVIIVFGLYLIHQDKAIETAIAMILAGISQLFAKDGATKNEYLEERKKIENEIIEELNHRVCNYSTDELRAELEKRLRSGN